MFSYRAIMFYGFAVFAMFFGSGNLAFPIQIGFFSGLSWIAGLIGLLLTGVLVPFCGLYVIKMYHGNYLSFFGQVGRVARIVLPLFTLSLLGSWGVVPRCITVAHGSMLTLWPTLSLETFSFMFCLLIFFLCLKDDVMMTILGKWMSPALLIILGFLIVLGIYYAPPCMEATAPTDAFLHGFFTGYQTMDLFAAFFFSALIFSEIKQALPSSTTLAQTMAFALRSGITGMLMLAIVYAGLVFLGAHYMPLLVDVSPERMLPTLAFHLLGAHASWLIALAVLLSCLTTAVALNNIYAQYCTKLFNISPCSFYVVLAATTLLSFAISLVDFKGIAKFLAPLLRMSYPGLIALTIMSIFIKGRTTLKSYIFYVLTSLMIAHTVLAYYNFL